MNVFKATLLAFLVVLLSACGTTITEAPETETESVEFEVQIVTSLPDDEAIRQLKVTNEEGEVVYFESDFVNRFHNLELEMRQTYEVFAVAETNGYAQSGTVSLKREITLVSERQSVTLNLKPAYSSLFLLESEDESAFSIMVRKYLDRDLGEDLVFTGGRYSSFALLPIKMVYVHFGVDTVEWSESAVSMTPEMFGDNFDAARVEIRYPGVPRTNCRSDVGEFKLSWENGFSQLTQELEVSMPCKG